MNVDVNMDAVYRRLLMNDLGLIVDDGLNNNESLMAKRNNDLMSSSRQLKNPWGDLSYSQLIEYAIESTPNKKLKLKEIYNWFIKYIPYFKEKAKQNITGWKVRACAQLT